MFVDLPPLRTPNEVRAAMHLLLDRVAAGEIPAEDAATLTSMMRDTLQAHQIQALSPVTVNIDARGQDARQALTERLAKMVGQRPPEPPSSE